MWIEIGAARSPLAFWSVATVFLVVMTGTTLPSPLFGIYEQRLHISSLSVTVIYGIYSIGVVGALAVLARFGSGIRLRTRLAAGLALSAVSAAVFLVTTSLGLLIAARVLSGLAAGLTSGTATSAMIGLGGTDRRARSAAIAVGVGFAANGLVAAIAAVFLSDSLHLSNRTLAGGVLTVLFLATAAGQLIVRRTSPRLAPIIGSSGLIAGLAVLALTLLAPSLPGLIAASIVIGASAGISTGAGLVSLAIAVPKSQLTKMTASYYIALYGSITVPVIGDGLIAQRTGIATAGLIVCIALAVAVFAVLVSRVHDRTTQPT